MQKIICFRPEILVEPVEAIAPNPVSGQPVTKVWRQYVHASGKVTAGLWSCENGSFELFSHTSTEICTILEGEAVIEHEDGSRETVRPGDCFVIPYGSHTIWHVENYVKKSFVCTFVEE